MSTMSKQAQKPRESHKKAPRPSYQYDDDFEYESDLDLSACGDAPHAKHKH